jgi:hypothetical protein
MVVAPKIVIVWVIQQYIFASRLTKEHHKSNFVFTYQLENLTDVSGSPEHGWMQAHGYFAIMGGFMLYDGDKALHTVHLEEL